MKPYLEAIKHTIIRALTTTHSFRAVSVRIADIGDDVSTYHGSARCQRCGLLVGQMWLVSSDAVLPGDLMQKFASDALLRSRCWRLGWLGKLADRIGWMS